MKYDLNNEYDINKFNLRCKTLLDKKCKVELKEFKGKRTVKQNSYLHVILNLFAVETGYTLEEIKQIMKSYCVNIFEYKKNEQIFYKSTSDLSTEEMQKFIEVIRDTAAASGIYLPTSQEYLINQFEILKQIENGLHT